MFGSLARSRRYRAHTLVERTSVGYNEASWKGLHTSNGTDAFLYAAQTGSPWTKYCTLCGQSAHRTVAAQLWANFKQICDWWEQIHQHWTHLLWVRLGSANIRGCSKGGRSWNCKIVMDPYHSCTSPIRFALSTTYVKRSLRTKSYWSCYCQTLSPAWYPPMLGRCWCL